ncbi:MAG: ABC transporter permease [Bacteriovoracaceae bacterium]
MNLNSLKNHYSIVIGFAVFCFFLIISLCAPLLATHDPNTVFSESFRLSPNSIFLFGTDDLGRDIYSRILYGGRVSLGLGFIVVINSVFLGTVLGLISGYLGGIIDQIIMRIVDLLMSIPGILLAILIVAILGTGTTNAIIAVTLFYIPQFIRIIRSQVIDEKNKQYVLASTTIGASKSRQMFVNILPNCLPLIIIQATMSFSSAILDVAALGFLGLGVQAPTPEWGTMLSDARSYMDTQPYMVIIPGLAIFFIVIALNLLGDGLRDILDPKLKRQS